MSKKVKPVVAVLLFALLAAGCGIQSEDALKPPDVRVYRPPQIWVTRPPTGTATAPVEAAGTPAPEAAAVEVYAGPTLDYEQYLIDEIEFLLNRIEGKLERTDTDP
jgi:hypothetical protein